MRKNSYSESVMRYVSELSKYGVINSDDEADRMFLNYLSTQTYDEDYIDSLVKDRKKEL